MRSKNHPRQRLSNKKLKNLRIFLGVHEDFLLNALRLV